MPSCVNGLHSEAQYYASRVEALERQVAAHSAELASGRGGMTSL